MWLDSLQLAFFYSILFIWGSIILSQTYSQLPQNMKWLFAFPVGLSLWAASVFIAITIKVPIEGIFLPLLLSSSGFYILGLLKKKSLKEALTPLKVTFIFFIGCSTIGLFDFSYFSYDSTELIGLGLNLAEHLKPSRSDSFASWGFFVPATHALAHYTNSKLLYNLQPLLGLHILCIALVFADRISQLAYNTRLKKLPIILFSALILLNHQSALHAVYIHNSISASLYLLITLCFTFELINDPKPPTRKVICLLTLLGISFVLHRVEGPVYWLLLVTGLLAINKEEVNRVLRPTALLTCIFLIGWYSYIAYLGAGEGGILSGPSLAAFIASLLGILLLLILQKSHTSAQFLLKTAFFSAVFIMLIANTLFLYMDPHKVHANLYSVAGNLFETYRYKMWGATWIIALIPLVAYGFVGRDTFHRLLLILFFALTLAIVSMGFFRQAYYVNNFDSSARMLVIFLPLLFVWSLVSFSRLMDLEDIQSANYLDENSHSGKF